ncbi:MAG: exodeoxyribonuclease III [Sedimentisphaerales bacterium]|nr:exodeoxyribonuclease III [Sedimentisphaerales bacterium]
MKTVRLMSWNVNGLRAVERKGFAEWLGEANPDVLCVQETKLQPGQVPEGLREFGDYRLEVFSAERPGYSGVAMWTRLKPMAVQKGLGIEKFDVEGRVLRVDFGGFLFYGIYFPNGGASQERLDYKLEFYEAVLEQLRQLNPRERKIVVCGDVNVAHKPIDLAEPWRYEAVSGFLPEERAWVDRLLEAGFCDALRMFDESGGNYTWWDYRLRARERNLGWRLDYFFVSEAMRNEVVSCKIHAEVMGSDHCPIELEVKSTVI